MESKPARSLVSLTMRMLRAYISSPYLFLWRTLELLTIVRLGRKHGFDLTRELDFDAGCGNGIIGQALVQRINLGLDLERSQLSWAADKRVYQALIQASATDVPVQDRSQRSVFCNCVIEHIPDDQAVFAELARILAPGGTMLLTLANSDFYRVIFGHDQVAAELRESIDASLAHVHYYEEAAVRRRLAQLGLEVLSIQSYISPVQARWWYKLRWWQNKHQHKGWRRRLAQVRRIPVTLATLPLLLLPDSAQGAGLAVVARRPVVHG